MYGDRREKRERDRGMKTAREIESKGEKGRGRERAMYGDRREIR